MLEKFYIVAVLVYMTSAFYGLSKAPNVVAERSAGTVGELALQIFAYLPVALLILRYWSTFVRGLLDCKWAIALIGLALASGLWAADPLFAFRKSLVLAATTAFGVYFGTRFRRDEQIALLCCALGLLAVSSVLLVAFFPQYGIDHFDHPGDWRGIFGEKNTFGKLMVLGTVAVCFLTPRWLRSGALRLACLAGFGSLVILSGGRSAAVVGTILLMLTLMYRFLRPRVVVPVMLLMLALLVFAFLFSSAADQQHVSLSFMGRDTTLTGRVGLWDAVLVAISKRPLLGYGFSSFWNGLAGPSASIVDAVHWISPNAHNGYLDLCLELGVVGLSVFGIGFVLRFRTAILDYWSLKCRTAMWPLVFLSFIMLYNVTESTLLRLNNIYWALYMASLIRQRVAIKATNRKSEVANVDRIEMNECPA